VPFRSAKVIPSSTQSPSVGAVDAPRADDPDRRLASPQHGADLDRRGVGPQHHVALRLTGAEAGLVHVEGVLHVAGGVVGRDVEGLEVVPVELDLRPVGHLVAEPLEDPDDALAGLGDRVTTAPRRQAAARQRDVERRTRQLGLQRRPGQRPLAGGQQRLDLVADAVGHLADPRTLLGRQGAHAAQDRRELALLAQEADPQLLERPLVGGRGGGLARAGGERFELSQQVGHAAPLRRGRP
jgi:hypothetical protein